MTYSENLLDETQSNETQIPSPMGLIEMITSPWIAQAIYVAAALGIADLLLNGAKSIDELAKDTNSHSSNLYRILRALASINIFTEVEPQKFGLTPIAQYLCSDHPNTLRSLAMMLGDEWHWRCWGEILNVVKTGKPAIKGLYQVDNTFEYFAKNEVSGAIFNDAMTNSSQNIHTAIIDNYDFSDIDRIIDIGGGYGTLITSILSKYQHMHGVIFDQPSVVSGAEKLLQSKKISARCETIGGDFFQSVPSKGDAYILSYIIHDWSDEDCIKILKNIRQGIKKDGRLLVIEAVVPTGNKSHFSKLMDIEMMVIYPNGRERTQAEFSRLYEASGFQLNRILSTAAPVSVIEGIPL